MLDKEQKLRGDGKHSPTSGMGAKKVLDDINVFLEVCQPRGVAFRPSYTIHPPGYKKP